MKDPVPTKPYQQARPAKFLDYKDSYYIKIGDEPALRVKNKRRFIKMLGEYGSEIANYIKEEKIKFRHEYDMVKLVTYLNNK